MAAILLEGLSDKKPKVPPACVGVLIKALELFGARAMPLKDLKAALPGMRYDLGNVDKTGLISPFARLMLHTPG